MATKEEIEAVKKLRSIASENENLNENVEKEEIPYYKSIPSGIAQGLLKGAVKFGRALGPLYGRENEQAAENTLKYLEKQFPTGENPIAGALARTGQILPFLASPGGAQQISQLLRPSLLGGILGETAGQSGIGETGQAIAEILGTLSPSFSSKLETGIRGVTREQIGEKLKDVPLAKKLGEFLKKSGESATTESSLIEEARKLGLKEEDISRMLNNKSSLLKNISSKGESTQIKFKESKEALSGVWDSLISREDAVKSMNQNQSSKFIKEVDNILEKLSTKQSELIREDLNAFINSKHSGADLINLWQDANYYISKNEGKLGLLKEPILRALKQISPELARDFKTTNTLYGNFANLSSKMAPGIAEGLLRGGENFALLHAIVSGKPSIFSNILGTIGGRKLAEIMVRNPRFHNLSEKFISSINTGKISAADKIYNQILIDVAKEDPEAAKKLSGISKQELQNLYDISKRSNNTKNK